MSSPTVPESLEQNGAVYSGSDPVLGNLCVLLYDTDSQASTASVCLVSYHGASHFRNMTLTERSRYFPAVRNLPPDMEMDCERRALAIAILRCYATMNSSLRSSLLEQSITRTSTGHPPTFDETWAGEFAATLRKSQVPNISKVVCNICSQFGFFSEKFANSLLLDVIYKNDPAVIKQNNALVYLMGQQLEQLFDPLTEYSPEPTEKIYHPPSTSSDSSSLNGYEEDTEVVKPICNELLDIQTNFTHSLVAFLQDFVVPLRARAMNNEIPFISLSRLNSVFPPTIDEVTRINCIFLESLQSANKRDAFEVIKACGSTIPYFYKAYMRHEAATKNFTIKLNEIYDMLLPYLTDDSNTVSYYSPAHIETIIHSSLNLARLKLVIDRLMKQKEWLEDEIELVNSYYKSAVGTIDDFAQASLKPYHRRVVTPTGKILTELATGWPEELQYGWVSRRVVTIVDAVNLKYSLLSATNSSPVSSKVSPTLDVLILFSDHILILKVDDNYTPTIHKPSIADILMHSLTSEKPLKNLPSLQVDAWASIKDVFAASYNNGTCLQLFVKDQGIQSDGGCKEHLRLYKFRNVNKYNDTRKFVELITKAKVLSKTEPLHLFQMTGQLDDEDSYGKEEEEEEVKLYSTAHEYDVYLKEERKCPFALLLNVDIDMSFLDENELFACYSVSFTTDKRSTVSNKINNKDEEEEKVKILGLTKAGTIFREIALKSEFASILVKEISKAYGLFLSPENSKIVGDIIKGNQLLVTEMLTYIEKLDHQFQTKLMQESRKKINLRTMSVRYPSESMDLSIRFSGVSSILSPTPGERSSIQSSLSPIEASVSMPPPIRHTQSFAPRENRKSSVPLLYRVKSFLSRSLSLTKKHMEDEDHKRKLIASSSSSLRLKPKKKTRVTSAPSELSSKNSSVKLTSENNDDTLVAPDTIPVSGSSHFSDASASSTQSFVTEATTPDLNFSKRNEICGTRDPSPRDSFSVSRLNNDGMESRTASMLIAPNTGRRFVSAPEPSSMPYRRSSLGTGFNPNALIPSNTYDRTMSIKSETRLSVDVHRNARPYGDTDIPLTARLSCDDMPYFEQEPEDEQQKAICYDDDEVRSNVEILSSSDSDSDFESRLQMERDIESGVFETPNVSAYDDDDVERTVVRTENGNDTYIQGGSASISSSLSSLSVDYADVESPRIQLRLQLDEASFPTVSNNRYNTNNMDSIVMNNNYERTSLYTDADNEYDETYGMVKSSSNASSDWVTDYSSSILPADSPDKYSNNNDSKNLLEWYSPSRLDEVAKPFKFQGTKGTRRKYGKILEYDDSTDEEVLEKEPEQDLTDTETTPKQKENSDYESDLDSYGYLINTITNTLSFGDSENKAEYV